MSLEIEPACTSRILEIVSRGPQGARGIGLNLFITYEVPLGDIDGANQIFTTQDPYSVIFVWLNGLRLMFDVDFFITGADTFRLTNAPVVGDYLFVDYVTADTN